MISHTPSLDVPHAAFVRQKFLAIPIAGTIAWLGAIATV
jgi:hypothetical protein